jgi:hypothetical protein
MFGDDARGGVAVGADGPALLRLGGLAAWRLGA